MSGIVKGRVGTHAATDTASCIDVTDGTGLESCKSRKNKQVYRAKWERISSAPNNWEYSECRMSRLLSSITARKQVANISGFIGLISSKDHGRNCFSGSHWVIVHTGLRLFQHPHDTRDFEYQQNPMCNKPKDFVYNRRNTRHRANTNNSVNWRKQGPPRELWETVHGPTKPQSVKLHQTDTDPYSSNTPGLHTQQHNQSRANLVARDLENRQHKRPESKGKRIRKSIKIIKG